MDNNTVRLLLVAGAVWYALSGAGGVGSILNGQAQSAAYSGRLTDLHSASRSMDPKDRAALSEALTAAGSMLAADRKGLVGTTSELQRYILAVTEFDYLGLGTPKSKYPAVASAIERELSAAYGKDETQVTADMRSRVSEVMAEAGRALR